jgi:hypothetical protein
MPENPANSDVQKPANLDTTKEYTVKAVLRRVFFIPKKGGWIIGRFENPDKKDPKTGRPKQFTGMGAIAPAIVGDAYELTGTAEWSAAYREVQMKVTAAKHHHFPLESGIVGYLTREAPNIGQERAKAIFAAYGDKSIEGAIIDKNARIGANVIVRPFPPGTEIDHDDWSVRDGIVVIPKSVSVPAGTVIQPE